RPPPHPPSLPTRRSSDLTPAMRFTGKTALVTGAGNGIGREYATGFASEGADIVVLDIDGVGVAETVTRIESGGGRARGLTVDIRSEEHTSELQSPDHLVC